MGAFWIRRIELLTSLSELVGYKAGIALTRERIIEFLGGDEADGEEGTLLRVRSEEYEEMLCRLLYGIGNIDSPINIPSRTRLWHRIKDDPTRRELYLSIAGQLPDFLRVGMDKALSSGSKAIDPRPFMDWAEKHHGVEGARMAIELLTGLNADFHKSPWGPFRSVEWKDTAQLDQLFTSEKIGSKHGAFFDQRYLDFLSHNFGSIDNINWRKFEALTCEFFDRLGFRVEIGKGRNDDSIDARIWLPTDASAPLILAQCKRQKSKVEKVVVKALYADIEEEKAQFGLVVTTSALSPGAKNVRTARGYPIIEANREILQKWIKAMRTPYAGYFLGE
jgi:Restriction endonuclease